MFLFDIFDKVFVEILNPSDYTPLTIVIDVFLLVLNVLLTAYVWWQFSECYQAFSYKKLYLFKLGPYFALQISYVMLSSILHYLFNHYVITMQLLAIFYYSFLTLFISRCHLFCFSYHSLYVYQFVTFGCFFNLLNAVIIIYNYIDPTTADNDFLFCLNIILAAAVSVCC